MDLPNFAPDPFLFEGNLTIDGQICPVLGLIANFNMALIHDVHELSFIGVIIHRDTMYGVFRRPPAQQQNINQQPFVQGQQQDINFDQDGQQQLVQQENINLDNLNFDAFAELNEVWWAPNAEQEQEEVDWDDGKIID